MWKLLVFDCSEISHSAGAECYRSPAANGKWDFSLCIIFPFPFISSKIREKATWVVEVESLGVWWCCSCGVGPMPHTITHVSADSQWFQRSLGLNYCSHIWLELRARPIPDLVLSPLPPFCGPEPVHSAAAGVSGEPWMVPARLNEPFIAPFQCPSCFRRAIIDTPLSSQLWSPALPGGRGAPFPSDSCIRVPPSPRTRSRHNNGGCSRLPGWENRTDTGVWRPSFQRHYCRIRSANWEEKWVRRPVIVTSLANKPDPVLPASSLETCHILAKKNPKNTTFSATHSDPTLFFGLCWVFWSFWSHGAAVMDQFLNWRTGAGTGTVVEGRMLGRSQNPWFCSDICNVFCCQQSTLGFNSCFAHWVHTKITSSALDLGTPRSKMHKLEIHAIKITIGES